MHILTNRKCGDHFFTAGDGTVLGAWTWSPAGRPNEPRGDLIHRRSRLPVQNTAWFGLVSCAAGARTTSAAAAATRESTRARRGGGGGNVSCDARMREAGEAKQEAPTSRRHLACACGCGSRQADFVKNRRGFVADVSLGYRVRFFLVRKQSTSPRSELLECSLWLVQEPRGFSVRTQNTRDLDSGR